MTGILFQGMFGLLYSLTGGIVSLTVMILCKKTGRFSIIGVSLAGGAAHNLAQLAVALTAVSGWVLFRYFPFLLFSGMAAGILIGAGALIVLERLPGFIRGERAS